MYCNIFFAVQQPLFTHFRRTGWISKIPKADFWRFWGFLTAPFATKGCRSDLCSPRDHPAADQRSAAPDCREFWHISLFRRRRQQFSLASASIPSSAGNITGGRSWKKHTGFPNRFTRKNHSVWRSAHGTCGQSPAMKKRVFASTATLFPDNAHWGRHILPDGKKIENVRRTGKVLRIRLFLCQKNRNQPDVPTVLFPSQPLLHFNQALQRDYGDPVDKLHCVIQPVFKKLHILADGELSAAVRLAYDRDAMLFQAVCKSRRSAKINVMGLLPNAVQYHGTAGNDPILVLVQPQSVQPVQNICFLHRLIPAVRPIPASRRSRPAKHR